MHCTGIKRQKETFCTNKYFRAGVVITAIMAKRARQIKLHYKNPLLSKKDFWAA